MSDLVKVEYVPASVIVPAALKLEQTPERLGRAAASRLVLGYSELSLACGETRARLSEQDVADGLKAAGVLVFDNKAVSKYKATFRSKNWPGRWWSYDLAQYVDPIPEFAIDTALKVKRAIPEAEFTIEEYNHKWRGDLDPFLSFKVPGVMRRFVVEVWEEPDFEAERIPFEVIQ